MPDQPLQNSLFEDDYLLRELGQVAHVPQVALTELVANAWDAGATRVELILPAEIRWHAFALCVLRETTGTA